MPFQFHPEAPPTDEIQYGFFTTEKGSSSGGYVIGGESTRNVNLFSSKQPKASPGFDAAENVVANLMACFHETTAGHEKDPYVHKFMMTSNYAKGGTKIHVCDSADQLAQWKAIAASSQAEIDLDQDMLDQLEQNKINVLKADAMVFKQLPGEQIVVAGACADAHPIIIIDEKNMVCAYIAGAHAAVGQAVLEETLKAMYRLGAKPEHIKVVIGPGLGPNSYEFGVNAPEALDIPSKLVEFVPQEKRCLLDMKKIVEYKVALAEIKPSQVFDMGIDTMGTDLYEKINGIYTRKPGLNPDALKGNGHLFFGARRDVKAENGDLDAQNAGAHGKTGRTCATVTMVPQRP